LKLLCARSMEFWTKRHTVAFGRGEKEFKGRSTLRGWARFWLLSATDSTVGWISKNRPSRLDTETEEGNEGLDFLLKHKGTQVESVAIDSAGTRIRVGDESLFNGRDDNRGISTWSSCYGGAGALPSQMAERQSFEAQQSAWRIYVNRGTRRRARGGAGKTVRPPLEKARKQVGTDHRGAFGVVGRQHHFRFLIRKLERRKLFARARDGGMHFATGLRFCSDFFHVGPKLRRVMYKGI